MEEMISSRMLLTSRIGCLPLGPVVTICVYEPQQAFNARARARDIKRS